jgi:hypothetical protein
MEKLLKLLLKYFDSAMHLVYNIVYNNSAILEISRTKRNRLKVATNPVWTLLIFVFWTTVGVMTIEPREPLACF